MNVVILTEGGKDYGYGHIVRCSSIYQAFEQYGIFPRFVVNGDESVKSILSEIPVDIVDWLNDFSVFFDADIVIIDSYLANLDFYSNISNNVALVVYIDDNNRLNYPKGIIVNGTLDASNMNYLQRENITYLVGNEFIPLRNDFWNIQKLKINDSIENILITMGGNDLRNLTPKILDLLNIHFPDVTKKVIITDSFNNVAEIKRLQNDSVELICSPNSYQIINTILSIDLAISASGQTLYELACMGVPTIAIGIIDNQKNNIQNWINQGFIEYAGCWNDANLLVNIVNKINYLQDKNIRYDKSLLGVQSVNGQGSLNIVKNILNEFYKDNSLFRKVQREDCFKIFEIANDDEVRKYSFNSEKISLNDHISWFNNILKNSFVEFYVLEYKKDIIGQLRLDYDEDYPVISISLNKKYRGLGLSKILLSKGLELIDGKVIAYIKKENTRSISFFKSMGFKKEDEILIKDCDAFKFIRE